MRNPNILIGINLSDSHSTGRIMCNGFEYANKHGKFDYLILVPKSNNKNNIYSFGYKTNLLKFLNEKVLHHHLDFIVNTIFTKRIVKQIKKKIKTYERCIVHLHNIHHCNINYIKLFQFLAKSNVKIFFTLHDMWLITGGCYFYYINNCFEWKNGCRNCVAKIKKAQKTLDKKYLILNKIKDKTTLICVSNWVKDQIKMSYWKDFKIEVVYGETNIVPLNKADSSLITHLNIANKKVVLTISEYWSIRKGRNYIYELGDILPNDYIIVVVGGTFDCKNYRNIIHVNTLKNEQLNSYYSIADVLISLSLDESLGLTTCEAQICGVPVVTFGCGGNKETVSSKTGYIVENKNINEFAKKIIDVCENHPFKKSDIINNGEKFKRFNNCKKLFQLYKS